VAGRRFVAIGGNKRVNCNEVRTSLVSKPTNTTYQALIGFFPILRAGELSSSEDGATESIGTPKQYGVAVGVWDLLEREKLSTKLDANLD
jgi:hypothetical protein